VVVDGGRAAVEVGSVKIEGDSEKSKLKSDIVKSENIRRKVIFPSSAKMNYSVFFFPLESPIIALMRSAI
jgi:hypothetical protein